VPTTTHPEFEVHILNELGIARARSLAGVFDRKLTDIEDILGPFAFAWGLKIRLMEAFDISYKALASVPENQKENE
jgi:hypothetical protein